VILLRIRVATVVPRDTELEMFSSSARVVLAGVFASLLCEAAARTLAGSLDEGGGAVLQAEVFIFVVELEEISRTTSAHISSQVK